ncbi:hypothetical protein BH10ACI1_BH10ACI1_15460 [soil metagenome]
MNNPEKFVSRLSIYAYNDDAELTANIIRWATSPDSFDCEILNIGANSTLKSVAVDALLNSFRILTIKCLQFDEIYISPEDFEKLLTMPHLVELENNGGSSSDYGGSDYTYSTLTDDHYKVLAASPHAKKLRSKTLDREVISDETKVEIENALPNLKSFNVF